MSRLLKFGAAMNSLALLYLLVTTLVWASGGWVTVWHWLAGAAAIILSYAALAVDIWRDQ